MYPFNIVSLTKEDKEDKIAYNDQYNIFQSVKLI